jgi:hypothetical protein
MTDMRDPLTGIGVYPARIHTELFGALASINPPQSLGDVVDVSPPEPGDTVTAGEAAATSNRSRASAT